jgi:hypothetical protein
MLLYAMKFIFGISMLVIATNGVAVLFDAFEEWARG